MGKYLAQRLLLTVPTIFLVSVAVFCFVRFLPGSAVDLILQQNTATYQGERAKLNHDLGLDKPLLTQYGEWVGSLVKLDFGKSLITKTAISSSLKARLPVTIVLGLLALLFSVMLAIPVGIVAAYFQDGPLDLVLRGGAVLGLAVPSFWAATMIVVLCSKYLHWSPASQYVPLNDEPLKAVASLIIPALVLALASGASLMRFVRTQMLEVLSQDYMRTARAKGMKERVLIVRHALKNTLIPVITIVGLQLGYLLGGAVIIETIFGIPGMGSMAVTAFSTRDYPTIQTINLLFALFLILVNIGVDVVYPLIDPRIRFG